jgi:hypothetical protein
MKKWSLLSITLLIAAGLMFSGCKKDEDDPIVDQGPTISLKTGDGYTFNDFEVEEGTAVKFGVVASKSTTHDNNLTRFNITYGNLTIADSTFNADSFDSDFQIEFFGVGEAKITFIITAEGGMTAEKELNVTVTEPPVVGVEIKKMTDIELGSFNDPIGSFYNTMDEMVYTVAQAKQNQEKVDFVFFRGDTNLNTFAAPDDDAAATIDEFQFAEWTTKNQTRFNLIDKTADDFDAINAEELHLFPEFDNENALTRANQLEVGQVVMFRTVNEKHGYIKVVDIYAKGDKIKIDVIVEN